jgi:rhodanese-related sulfurtransferase
MMIQIAFSPEDGRLLSAQVAGFEGVDKRLDVLSSFIQLQKTIYDLEEFEHAYAPPYSSAKDPVNMAGFVAENILHKRLEIFYWNEIENLGPEDVLIDVRRKDEFDAGKIAHAINIPVDEIRGRLNEIPSGKTIHIYCEAGLRGYLAQRILKQNGFDKVLNLSGGYKTWNTCNTEMVLSMAEAASLQHA